MAKELELQRDYLKGEVVTTIYFGGGTPSLLSEQELSLLFKSIHLFFNVDSKAEITFEANPDDLYLSKALLWKQLGINRLSIGIQSFSDEILSYLNRAHNSHSAKQCVTIAREAGFDNISIDLIYGIPNQTLEQWNDDVLQATALATEHLSCYSLTIEPKTAFGNWAKKGKLVAASDDASAQHFEWLMEKMKAAGYEHYEISNFCKPGSQSKHNSNYWRQEKYLGIGPSAHAYNGTSRQYTVANNIQYIKSIESGLLAFEKEELSRFDLINEFIMTSLRTSWGCSIAKLQALYNYAILDEQKIELEKLIRLGLITIHAGSIVLTKNGKLVADKITTDLFVLPS